MKLSRQTRQQIHHRFHFLNERKSEIAKQLNPHPKTVSLALKRKPPTP